MRIFWIPAKYTEHRLFSLKTSVGGENLTCIYIEQYYSCSLLFKRVLSSMVKPDLLRSWLGYGNQVTRNAPCFLNVSTKRHLKLSWLLSVSAASEGQRALAHTMHVHPSIPPPDVTAASDEHNTPCAAHAFGVLHAGLKHPCDVTHVTLNTAACFVWGRFGCIPGERINWRVSDRFLHLSVRAEHIFACLRVFCEINKQIKK